jgi:hypothetical protein
MKPKSLQVTCWLIFILTISIHKIAFGYDHNFVKYDDLYKSPSTRQFIAFGGYYSSGSVSRDLQISGEYLYKNNKFSHDISLLRQLKEKTPGSTAENKNLYDFEIVSKLTIPASQNYLLLYNRTKHDSEANYLLDINSAIGMGRKLFHDIWEVDVALGYDHIEKFGYQTTINFGSDLALNLTKKIAFGQRTFFFVNIHGKNQPNSRTDIQNFGFDSKTRLSYQLKPGTHIELIHQLEKKRYDSLEKNTNIIQSKKYNQKYTLHLKFDL